jgi:hypothetical protein
MDLEDQVSLSHLLFKERKCSICKEVKDLLSDYYPIRKLKKHLPSSYSYECKSCAAQRIISLRNGQYLPEERYPNW